MRLFFVICYVLFEKELCQATKLEKHEAHGRKTLKRASLGTWNNEVCIYYIFYILFFLYPDIIFLR